MIGLRRNSKERTWLHMTTQAFLRGAKKGMQIVANPDPRQLRQTRMQLQQRDTVRQAWLLTGATLQSALKGEKKQTSDN